MIWSWLRRHPNVVDAVIVLALAAGYLGHAAHLHRWAAGLPLSVVEVAPLILRRRYPLQVLALVAAASVADAAIYGSHVPIAAAVAVYTVAERSSRTTSLTAAGTAAVAILSASAAASGFNDALGSLVPLAIAWVAGDNLGTRRAYLHALEERAERLEREQAAEAARAVAEEQARIARELHDVIAHNLSVIVVQAAAADDVFDTRPESAREALRAIETTGRGALAELRGLLGAIRDGDAEYTPQPGLDRLDELVEQVRGAGLHVAVSVEGAPRPLPAGVDRSAYRVVQEALTNTLKHAGAQHVEIGLRFREDGLDVRVADDGRGNGDGGGTGSGLIGMRERVSAFGGSLRAGPRPSGGFAVAARFPL